MFRRYAGKTKTMYFKKQDTAVADVIMEGGLVSLNDSGKLTYLSNDSTDRAIGVAKITVAAIDTSSWNTAPWLPVEVPVENAVEWTFDVDSDAGLSDSDAGRLLRDAKLYEIGAGTVEIRRLVIARELLKD